MQYTLTSNDVVYLKFYLKERNPISNSINYYDLSSVTDVYFRLRAYGSSTNTISMLMSIVDATLGCVRALVTVPSYGKYYSEVEVSDGNELITWDGPIYIIKSEMG